MNQPLNDSFGRAEDCKMVSIISVFQTLVKRHRYLIFEPSFLEKCFLRYFEDFSATFGLIKTIRFELFFLIFILQITNIYNLSKSINFILVINTIWDPYYCESIKAVSQFVTLHKLKNSFTAILYFHTVAIIFAARTINC